MENPTEKTQAGPLCSGDLLGVSVGDGKYIIQCDGDGRMRALRYGQPWRDLTGDGMVLALTQEVERLRDGIGCAANALTDSILCSGNDAATNMHFVKKLRALSSPNVQSEPRGFNQSKT